MTRPVRLGWLIAAGAGLVAAGALTALLPPEPSLQRRHDRFVAADHATAVLAWAKANCDSGLELAANAPRTQMEIILQVAASYDHESSRRGIANVCLEARGTAKHVMANDTAPAVRGERPLYQSAPSKNIGAIVSR